MSVHYRGYHSVKTDLNCTFNYAHSVNHNFPCEENNDAKFANLLWLSLHMYVYVKFVKFVATHASFVEAKLCDKIGCVDNYKNCFCRPFHIRISQLSCMFIYMHY